MTVRAAIASGNLTAAGTWGAVDATSYLNSETGSEVLTTAYSGTRSSAFTPGAITIDGIAVKLSVRTGTTGTISVNLEKDSDDSQVAGTEVTIDCADLPVAATADLNGGWIFFKFAAPVTLVGATAYQVAAKTSSSTQVSLFRDGTADNLSRFLRTTTTGAPAAGDDLIICGEKTGAGAETALVVTQDQTAATDYGAAATSLVTPAIAICDGGTLQSGVTAATAYVLKVSGNVIVYSGGTLNIGTSGTPVPSGGSSFINVDCVANVDFGLLVRNAGTWNEYGTKGFTASPSNHYALLTADENAAQTVIDSISDTTGWQVSDELCFSPTTRTSSEAESKIISTVAAGTVTLTAGLTNAHSGTNDANGDIRCEIGNLTRNVGIRGVSTTVQTYVVCESTAIVTLRYAEFQWLGSATVNKRGFNVNTTTGTFDMQYCSLHDFVVTSSCGIFTAVTSGSGITFSNNVTYNINANHFVNVATTGVHTVSGNMCCKNVGVTPILSIADAGMTLTNNMISASANFGMLLNETNGVIGTHSGNVVHSCASSGVSLAGSWSGTISSLRSWRHTNSTGEGGIAINMLGASASGRAIIDGLVAFGNQSQNIALLNGRVLLTNAVINSGATLTCPVGMRFGNGATNSNATVCELENCSFGATTAHATGDLGIWIISNPMVVMHNTTLASSTEVFFNSSTMSYGSYICSLKHDGVAGAHKTWKYGGRTTGAALEIDTAQFHTASPSLRMYPGVSGTKLESSTWEAAVASGATLTPSVRVRHSTTGSGDSASYNGSTRARLIVKKNVAAGIAADTVLATATSASDGAANGAWELISGTTAAVTDDAILEFCVDCEGTAGWVGVDDFACVSSNPNGMKYWSPQHAGPLALGLPSSGVSGFPLGRLVM